MHMKWHSNDTNEFRCPANDTLLIAVNLHEKSRDETQYGLYFLVGLKVSMKK